MSTVITPFQGTEPFSTVTFNNRISQINTGFSYISNPNLLDNWYFGNPVDQRGGYVVPPDTPYYSDTGLSTQVSTVSAYTKATKVNDTYGTITVDSTTYYVAWSAAVRGYTGAGYGIDRWCLVGDAASVIINNDSITLNGGTSGAWWNQYLDNQDKFIGRTVTFSVLYTGNNLQTVTGVLTSDGMLYLKNAPNGWDTIGVENGKLRLQISCNANLSKSPIAAKLELGDTQTLAHQGENGNWALNEIPNYADTLERCQRYAVKLNGKYWMPSNADGALRLNIPLPVTMRAKPSVTFSQESQNTGTVMFDDNLSDENQIQFFMTSNGGWVNVNNIFATADL